VDGQIQSTKNGYIVPDHALLVAQKYRECQLALEFAKVALQESKVNAEKFNPILKTLGDCYHPVNLDTGTLKTASLFKTELEAIFQTCHEVEIQTPHSDKQKKCMQKARKLQGVLINTISFFERSIMAYEEQLDLQCVPISLKTHPIDEESSCSLGEELSEKELFRNVLLPICYLQNIVPKAKDAEQKVRIQNTTEMICQRYKGYLLDWIQTPRGQELHGAALECAQIFQRSSSCVEGRNGRLSLMYGTGRGLSERRLKILTILHNFHIKREDGSTAAERFFEKKPEELFNYVLDKVSFPVRPRQRMAACV
jgi:hypothetical protein